MAGWRQVKLLLEVVILALMLAVAWDAGRTLLAKVFCVACVLALAAAVLADLG